jgi:hypothetical protein
MPTIQLKRSSTPGNVPASLAAGELALNSADQILFYSDSGGNVHSQLLSPAITAKSVDYTLVLTDAGDTILHPTADTTARTFTIPDNATVPFPINTRVIFINQHAAGTLTIAITTDAMFLSPGGGTGSRNLAPSGMATAVKVTATEWLISGTGLT